MKTLILSCFSRPQRLVAPIILIAICLFPPATAHRLTAQTVSWTSSHPDIVSVDETTGLVTPVSAGTTTIIATITKNGKTVTSSKTVEVSLSPPPITINGVKWAQGNVTFDPSSCIGGVCTKLMIAEDPYNDKGPYFQWYGGSGTTNNIIGYPQSGNWNVTPNVNDTSTWRYVQPDKAYGFPESSWPGDAYSGRYSEGYNSYGTSMDEWTGNNPCTVIGNGWRLPTYADIIATHPANTASSWSMTGWTYSSANGGYLKHTATGLIFHLFGWRSRFSNGYTEQQAIYGAFWSSTNGGTDSAWHIWVNKSNGLYIRNAGSKADGFSVRCVKD